MAQDNVRHAEVFISSQPHLRRGMTFSVTVGVQRQFDEADALTIAASPQRLQQRLHGGR